METNLEDKITCIVSYLIGWIQNQAGAQRACPWTARGHFPRIPRRPLRGPPGGSFCRPLRWFHRVTSVVILTALDVRAEFLLAALLEGVALLVVSQFPVIGASFAVKRYQSSNNASLDDHSSNCSTDGWICPSDMAVQQE